MDLAGLIAHLEALKKAASNAGPPAATAMAKAVQYQIKNVALKQVAHAPGLFFRAAPMRPPAYASGRLSRSIIMRPASGTIRGTAMVGATARYAAIQEFGGKTWPSHGRFMHWVNSGGEWWMREVTIPPHPYFRPTVDRMVHNGDLSRAAYQAFWVRIQPYI